MAQRGRRITIDLTEAAAQEIDRLREMTGLTTAALFRHAVTLLRVYVDAEKSGKEVKISKPGSKEADRLVLPIPSK